MSGRQESCSKNLREKTEEKTQIGRPRYELENNIQINF